MDVLAVVPALREDRLAPAPLTARKLIAAVPFILHAVQARLESGRDPSLAGDSASRALG